MVRLLIDRGASLERTDDLGQTPLIRAVEAAHAAVVALLIERGVDVNQRDWFELSPLEYAAVGGHRKIFGRLMEAGATRGLLDAVAFDDVALVRRFLGEGQDPNRDCHCLAGPLPDYVARRGHPEIVRLFVEAGATFAPTDGEST